LLLTAQQCGTSRSIHNVKLLLTSRLKGIVILLACGLTHKPKFVFACSLENQTVGDDEASPGKGNAINNQESMDASS